MERYGEQSLKLRRKEGDRQAPFSWQHQRQIDKHRKQHRRETADREESAR